MERAIRTTRRRALRARLQEGSITRLRNASFLRTRKCSSKRTRGESLRDQTSARRETTLSTWWRSTRKIRRRGRMLITWARQGLSINSVEPIMINLPLLSLLWNIRETWKAHLFSTSLIKYKWSPSYLSLALLTSLSSRTCQTDSRSWCQVITRTNPCACPSSVTAVIARVRNQRICSLRTIARLHWWRLRTCVERSNHPQLPSEHLTETVILCEEWFDGLINYL